MARYHQLQVVVQNHQCHNPRHVILFPEYVKDTGRQFGERGAVVCNPYAGLKLRIHLFRRSRISHGYQEVCRQRRTSHLQDGEVADRHAGLVKLQWNPTIQEMALGLLPLCQQIIRCAQYSPFCLFRISLTDRYPTAVPGSGGKSQRNRQNGNSSINIVAQKVHYKYSFNVVEPLLVAAQMLVDFGAFIDEVDDSGNTQLEFYEKESAADKVGRFASYFFI